MPQARAREIGGAMSLDQTYKVAIGPALTEKIQPGSPYWRDFNGAFENREVNQPQFVSYICGGHTFTTWHDSWRKSENYIVGQHIGVDFDTEDKRSTIDHLMKDPFISKYATLIYTTPSHTIDAPRARVVFLLDTPIHQPKNYVLAVSSLLWLFGAADQQCKDPCRFFYGGQPDGQFEWPENVLPLSLIKDMVARYKTTGQREKRTIQKYSPKDADEKEVAEALKHIPPWNIEYDQWLAVLMAIHSEFPGPNGLSMADAWAQGHPGEVERKWRSFDTNGNATGRIGIGTLFAMAQEHGYRISA